MKKLSLLFVLPLFTGAQVPSLLKDLSPGNASSVLQDMQVLPNNHVVFGANCTPGTLSGIFSSDGSTAGTHRLCSFTVTSNFVLIGSNVYAAGKKAADCYIYATDGTHAGTDSVIIPGAISVSRMQAAGNVVLAAATMSTNAEELWRSDGTSSGTYSLASFSALTTFSVINNILYFSGASTASGTELYRSDGSVSGTFMLKDIWSGGGSGIPTFPNPIKAVVGTKVFFLANDGSSGDELWCTDGTISGTALMKDINPGTASSGISMVYAGNNGVYFKATEPASGFEVWFSDGTSVNTQMVADANPGASGVPNLFPVFSGNSAYYFFWLGGNLVAYKTDGSAAGTKSINLSTSGPAIYGVIDYRFELFNNELYFLTIKRDHIGSGDYDTLCFNKADLNLTSRTVVMKEYMDFMKNGNYWSPIPTGIFRRGSTFVYFVNVSSGNPFNIAIFDPVSMHSKIYYKYGTNNMVLQSIDYQPLGNNFYLPFHYMNETPAYLDLVKDSIYKIGQAGYTCGSGMQFWKHEPYHVNGKTYFIAFESTYGLEWYGTDYTTGGTGRLKDIYPGSTPFDGGNNQNNCMSNHFYIKQTPVNLFFGADDGANGFEMWVLNNIPTSPIALADLTTESGMTLYPNPSNHHLSIDAKNLTGVKMYNALGALVRQLTISEKSQASLDVSALQPGIYIVSVTTSAGEYTGKFVKSE